MTFSAGNTVTWLHQPRGGYGYLYPVDGTVVHVAGRHIVIRVPLRSGKLVERRVKPENLRPRAEA
jgi:hypothetical protein